MATTDTRNHSIERPIVRREDHDTRMVWTLVTLVVLAILAYAAYTSYYVAPVPMNYGTSASNVAPEPTTTTSPTTTSPTTTQ